MLRSGNWFRGQGTRVTEFERKYAQFMGAKSCLATASGTTALIVAMHVLGVEAGDEVIVSPYTFSASYNAIFMMKALPVFADTDPATFTIDPAKIEAKVTDRTRAIMPVHILGLPCAMDPILAIAKKHNLVVVEDACQAWLAEYRGRKCGTVGDLGCFSFQNSKHIPAGEGGAILGNDELTVDRCHSFHNCGRAHGAFQPNGSNPVRGANFRMQEFQAVILMSQLKRVEKDTQTREQNAQYLASRLKQIPGIAPYRLNPGATRGGVPPVPVPLSEGGIRQRAARQVPARARRRGHPLLGWLRTCKQRWADRGGARPPRAINACFPRSGSIDTARRAPSLATTDFAARPCGLPRTCSWGHARTWTTSPTRSRRSTRIETSSPDPSSRSGPYG